MNSNPEPGYWLRCTPLTDLTCSRCGAAYLGAHDAQRTCATCRGVRLGTQQYEDKQAAAWAALQRITRVLITGSRTWTNHPAIWTELSVYRMVRPTLVHGNARGADRIAAGIWQTWGLPIETHPADWSRHGKAAGHVRNRHMVALGADVCLAFIRDCSPGATACTALAHRAGIPVTLHTERTQP